MRFFIIVFMAVFSVAATTKADSLSITGAGGSFSVPVVSMKEARFLTVVKQQYDFSCGSAALATLLTYFYQNPVNEQTVLTAMYEKGNKEKIHREGFSLLDIKRYLEENGYRADGFVAPLDMLSKKGVPAITLINDHGYNHFVVVKGVSSTQVLVADPAMGTKIIPRQEFEAMWNRILFIIRNKEDIAVKYFNSKKEWKVREQAPLEAAVNRDGLSSSALLLPNSYDF